MFRYDRWACRKIFDKLQKNHSFEQEEKCFALAMHIVAAQAIWHGRIASKSTESMELWPTFTSWEHLHERLENMHRQWKTLLGSFSANQEVTCYKNSQGVAYETRTADILQHVIIHGQHHRAQIALRLREAAITPPATDYIYYLREQ